MFPQPVITADIQSALRPPNDYKVAIPSQRPVRFQFAYYSYI